LSSLQGIVIVKKMTTPVKERQFESDEKLKMPSAFIWRRLHSILGLWLVLYLFEHLLVNSQAALFFQDDGYGFVTAVNKLEALPYLKVIELVFLGLPFLVHGIWGMYYAWTAKPNSYRSNGSLPELPQYKRNRAYTWERITAWLLVFGVVAHVVHMRFWSYPVFVEQTGKQNYMVRVSYDRGLPLVAEKLNVKLYQAQDIQHKQEELKNHEEELEKVTAEPSNEAYVNLLDQVQSKKQWLQAARKKKLKPGEVLGSSPNPGGAFFLMVRETFKSPLMVILYSIFVITAAYHAFQGLWAFMIRWGITLTRRSQKRMRTITHFLMGLVMLLGLWAAWGTYWTFQFQK
jgi:succinate dehydrogenase / fumarate reductase cytochrome b subunit